MPSLSSHSSLTEFFSHPSNAFEAVCNRTVLPWRLGWRLIQERFYENL